ncbi:MAG: hypothetical protein NT022_00655 [Deltaproteobacteria bacterium]|nr:hypothetical protein [Deltaproteobacteria bacterium]
MNVKIHQVSLWTIVVLITIVGFTDKVEAVKLQADRQALGKSRLATGNNINSGEDTKWGYCYEPDIKIVRMNDNTYRSYHCKFESGWTGYFEIYHKDRKVYSERIKEGDFSIDENMSDVLFGSSLLPPPGKDINGDGIPEIVMQRHVGGPQFQGHYSYSIYSLGRRVKKLATLEGGHSPMQFKDLDGDGHYEVIGYDWAFAYFLGTFGTSPHPVVILKWQGGRYHLDYKRMKKPSPTHEELIKKAMNLRESDEPYFMNIEAWYYIIDLIYSGNGNSAWKFLDMYWVIPPEERQLRKKREFISVFKKQLVKSLYWKDLRILNGWVK